MSRRRKLISVAVVVAVLAIAVPLATASGSVRTSQQVVVGVSEPDGRPVTLDTTLYLPSRTPAPAVLLAHGFGGSRQDLDAEAKDLANAGYLVLAYTARGFGKSGGLIHLDSLSYEVKDAQLLVDWLAARPEVEKRNGDPRVAVAGASYGGALALMLAGTDRRIDAVAADITWNDLATALFPNNAAGQPGPAVWKKLWAGELFQGGVPLGSDPSCGRFAPDVCRAYQAASSSGRPDAAMLALLHNSSPATVTANITAPVLLSQGEQDSLFALSEADANERQISAHGTPVRVMWRSGGHDGGDSLADDTLISWLSDAFGGRIHGAQPFDVTQIGSSVSAQTGRTADNTLRLSRYPAPDRSVSLPLTGPPQPIGAPAGGSPAAITSGPGLGALAAAPGATAPLVGQTAAFCSQPLSQALLVGGGGTVDLTIQGPPDATLFISLHDRGSGQDVLPAGLVAPIRIATAGPTRLQLPWIVHSFGAGHQVCVDVSTTDAGYFLPSDPRTYVVAVNGPLTVNRLSASIVGGGSPWGWVLAGLGACVLAVGFVLLTRPFETALRASSGTGVKRSSAATPVVVDGLVKEYGDGYRAVDGISFTVDAGQVVGLLGPNGAGKTTALRVLVGLINPTAGEVRVLGETITPGAPVLARVGAFIEGPGFLPHLSGRKNLRLYWAATGRPTEDAQFDVALDIAGLGASIDRKVKAYSHGMKQRLGIAQAMLGLPEILVLDEPTNGLDPPQIAEMREVMRAYARTGRTVVVSSHLLAEVEQTCTHVVVMHKGKVVAAGTVSEVAGGSSSGLAVEDPGRAAEVLREAGIESAPVPIRRALEDVFLHLVGEDES